MNVYRLLRRGTVFRVLSGQEPFVWVGRRPGIQEFGSKYGRWAIDTSRLGADTTLASFGLGEDVSFEDEVIRRFGCRVAGFDPTPRSVQFMQSRAPQPRFTHFPFALAAADGTMEFAAPPGDAADQVSASARALYADAGSARYTVPCRTLASALALAGLVHVDVLKLDVEGAEYEVLAQAAAQGWLARVTQILVEFHHFLPGLSAQQTRDSLRLLASLGFEVAWVGRTNHEYLLVKAAAGR